MNTPGGDNEEADQTRWQQVKEGLELRQMSQKVLGERASLSKETIQRALRGDQSIKPSTWVRIAHALDCWWDDDGTLRVRNKRPIKRHENQPYLH